MNQERNKSLISEKIKKIRGNALERQREHRSKYDQNKPVSFWTKKDRLLNEIGKELTIILRTRGCKWALGDSGGCSMCGYIRDANINDVESQNIINQFDYALERSLDEIQSDKEFYILKIFNSGSFFDDTEMPKEAREYIYIKISKIDKIKEFVVESRPKYVTQDKLVEIKEHLPNKYVEIGIGLETVDDYIRLNYINKGFTYSDFLDAFNICKANDIGVKAYLLFKPLFLSEQAAIDDCKTSIMKLLEIGINSISINPVNIQKETLVEYLWFQNRYRPPWLFSIIKCLKDTLSQQNLIKTRLLCDPSGAGKKRGAHNCIDRECNNESLNIIRNFILSQNISELKFETLCNCRKEYQFYLM